MLARIREAAPLTVAAFMELALYDPDEGYYAQVEQRSGKAGDFFSSVDVGALFGELLSELVVRAWRALDTPARPGGFLLCEVGAGNCRLTRDILDGLERHAPETYPHVRVALVERSARARAAQRQVLGRHADRLSWTGDELPGAFDGIVIANELLDAMPVHRVEMTPDGLRELYVVAEGEHLALRSGPLSTPRLREYFDTTGVTLRPGAVADVSLAAIDWLAAVSRSLRRGYVTLIDYGHEARLLYGSSRATGTLRGYRRHAVTAGDEGAEGWLAAPGTQDLTAHVDFTAVRAAARREGLDVLADVDQSRFLAGLGLADRLAGSTGTGLADVKRRLAAQALVGPEGLGGSHRVLLLGKNAPETGSGPRALGCGRGPAPLPAP
jgi:SAM-dependent MidA family methyltransferase